MIKKFIVGAFSVAAFTLIACGDDSSSNSASASDEGKTQVNENCNFTIDDDVWVVIKGNDTTTYTFNGNKVEIKSYGEIDMKTAENCEEFAPSVAGKCEGSKAIVRNIDVETISEDKASREEFFKNVKESCIKDPINNIPNPS